MPDSSEAARHAAHARPILKTIARLISTDRRAVVLATDKGEVLLSNAVAGRLGLDAKALDAAFEWPATCARARRSGSVVASATLGSIALEGELVHLTLGQGEAFLLRLVEGDQEAVLLQNRARAATLLRVSHDLRTPIQSLLASSEALFDGVEETSDPRAVRVRKSAQVALGHIEKVIRVIRGELTGADLQADQDIDIAAEARDIIEMIEPIALGRGAVVALAVDPAQPMILHGPAHYIRALLQNMFDNSVKHGGDTVTIRLSISAPAVQPHAGNPGETMVTVEVADEGGGMPAAQKARLLGTGVDGTVAKVAADPGAERPTAGLSVLAHALHQLGGHLEVLDRGKDGGPLRDRAGQVTGTILRAIFSLPRADVEVAPSGRAPDSVPAQEAQLSGLGILVVEDSPPSRDWLVHSLSRAGARVESAGNGLKALEMLSREDATRAFDVLLTDMTLPHMHGVDLLRRLRGDQNQGRTKWQGVIIGLTAHVDDRLRDICLSLGMNRLLEKPIRNGALCEAVHAAVHGRQETARPVSKMSPRPRVGDATTEDPLARHAVADLVDQLGAGMALGFMGRAHAEARSILDRIAKGNTSEESKRLLHAATGSSGLTGLELLEQALRRLELALEEPEASLKAALLDAETAFVATQGAMDALAAEADVKR